MPKNLQELAEMIAKRDGITLNEALIAIKECATEMEYAFYEGSLDAAEDILREELMLEPDYLFLFIN